MKFNFPNLFVIIAMFLFASCDKIKKETEKEAYKEMSYFTVNDEGDLVRPNNYRSWIYVGTPLTPNDMNNGKAPVPEFHSIYIDPASFEHYKKTGNWKEGTIFVTEQVSVGSKAGTSGNGYFMGDFIGLVVALKSKTHFPDEPGNWAYFSYTNPEGGNLANTAKAFETNRCNTCHGTSASDDFVFTQYYPVLRAAKNVGSTVVPENAEKR